MNKNINFMGKNTSAAILAGGRGKRLIPHKGLLKLGDKTIIAREIGLLGAIFSEIIIIANQPEYYKGFKLKVFSDIILNKGALGGIYSALKHSKTPYNFITGSDMPYPNAAFIKYMAGFLKNYDVVVPEFAGQLEPLYAFYSKDCISVIENQFHKNDLRIQDLFTLVATKIIDQKKVLEFDPQGLSFTNINTPEEYTKVNAAFWS